MAILKYSEVRDKASTLRAMTSLDREEFDTLAEAFGRAWEEHLARARRNSAPGGRPEQLQGIEEKVLFILFYLKTYPLQEVLGHLFGLSQGQANVWVHRLSEVLQSALRQDGHLPARLPEDMLARLAEEDAQRLGIDGTERRIQRPQEDAEQRQYYSGKKAHTVKNNLIAGLDDRQIKYLSTTHEGKKHDKKICDEEGVCTPVGSDLYRDSGFQGHTMDGVVIHQPQKKPRGGELTLEEKEHNRLISQVRVVIEQVIAGVKRCHIVKDVFRNTKHNYSDTVIELACGLHNFRSDCRLQAY